MEESVFEKILKGWANLFYTGPIWFLCSLFALIVGIKHYRKEKSYQLFIIYCLSSLTMMNILHNLILYSLTSKGIGRTIFLETSNTLFTIVEVTVFFYWFKNILNTKFIKQVIKIIWIIFIAICIIFVYKFLQDGVSKDEIRKNSYLINVIEFFTLLLLCLFYFYQLLIKETNHLIPLSKSPSFWIISGLFFYCIVSLPALLIGNKLYLTSIELYFIMGAIHYISISLLFLCIAKAFSCKTTLTT
jgi:hypothetical protein